MMKQYVFSQLEVGMSETLDVDLSQDAVDDFVAVSGDASSVHIEDEYARSRGFNQKLVHGALLVAYISQLIGMRLPGKHGVLRMINCEFRRPCYAPNTLFLLGKIENLVPSIRLARLAIEIHNAQGDCLVVAKAETILKC